MITNAVLCLRPPVLFRELCGQQDVAADLRQACVHAVTEAVVGALGEAVVGGAERSAAWDPGLPPDVRGFGAAGTRTRSGLPLSLGVGQRLLDLAGWSGPTDRMSLGWDASDTEVAALALTIGQPNVPTALVVLADGSARRAVPAPGGREERATDLDDQIAVALGAGDAAALRDLDRGRARELMVAGASAFSLLGNVGLSLGRAPEPALRYRGDPFGVSYFVSSWRFPAR